MRTVLIAALLAGLAGVASAQGTDNEARLRWQPVNGATSYRVHWGTDSSRQYETSVHVGNNTTYVLEGLPGATNIYLAVTAHNGAGASEYSVELQGWARPVVSNVVTDCTPIPEPAGGADCTAFISGRNFQPDVQVMLAYPGVVVGTPIRDSDVGVQLPFTISADAQGGSTELAVRNPWFLSPATIPDGYFGPTSGAAGPVVPDVITITPIVLPGAVEGLRYVD